MSLLPDKTTAYLENMHRLVTNVATDAATQYTKPFRYISIVHKATV
jgi:hypothetical protein